MKFLSKGVWFLFLLPIFAFADQVEVGSRPMSEEAAAQIERERTKQIAGLVYSQYPPVYYMGSHQLIRLNVLGKNEYSLQLEDGSEWKISAYDWAAVLNWKIQDPLTITQNNRWFTKYEYRIINQANGTSTEANLYIGPTYSGEFSRFITIIDYGRREIMLNDNTHWEISSLDASIFKDWALNDYVILGTNSNSSWWDSEKEAILINVNVNNCVRAKQF